jgi:dihydrofolate reductase
MKTSVYIATSLDGFIARNDGILDWLVDNENPTGDDYGYSEFISNIDAIVMGRGTFEKVLSFPSWPYNKRVFVLSTSLQQIPDGLREKATVLSMKPTEVLNYLSKNGYEHLYIDGGKVIQSFLQEDCIDEMIITKIPVLIGNGIPLFGFLERDLLWKHVKTNLYPNGLIQSHYERKRY